MKIGRWIVAALLAGGLAWGAVAWRAGTAARARSGAAAALPARPDSARGATDSARVIDDSTARAPAGVRVRVQVVNATKTRGLARRATRWLRDRGFDVVEIGTTRAMRDSSMILDRSGHPDWAARAARAMGGARVEARPDSSRYLDLTVLVGRSWQAPSQALDP